MLNLNTSPLVYFTALPKPKRTTGTDLTADLYGPRNGLYILEKGNSFSPSGSQIPGQPAHCLDTNQTS
jgi:hypothetical protein